MKRLIIYLLIALILIIISIFVFPKKIEKNIEIDNYKLSDNGQIINFFDAEENLIFKYSINDFRKWAKNNWSNIFIEEPKFGDIRKVEIDNFSNFSNLSISNDNKFLAFTVSDYAVLTDISFISLFNLEDYKLKMIDKKIIGQVEKINFSPDDNYIAYLVNTARVSGDYLRVDDLINMTKIIKIDDEEILNYLELENSLVVFSDLLWDTKDIIIFETFIENLDLNYTWQYDIIENKLELLNN